MDIRQTPPYAQFMKSIGWKVEIIDGVLVFIKPFPLIGSVIKIQRCEKIPDIKKLLELKKKYRARSISIEPDQGCQISNFKYQILPEPYLPTKTILIDLSVSEEKIFNRFSQAKRRAVRHAQKNKIEVKESQDVEDFIRLKNKSAGLLGFMTTSTVKPLWDTFAPKQASIVCAYTTKGRNPIAAIFLLFNNKTAYYWLAAANEEGKKSFAPTLLVWEALRLAKKKGCTVFDFEGIYDERYPNLNKNWQGFSKFKSEFGGEEIYYPKPMII